MRVSLVLFAVRLVSNGPGRWKRGTGTVDIRAEKLESLEWISSIRETNENFDWRNSCKRLVPSRLHELRQSKFSFVSRIEFIRSKLSSFSAHVSGASDTAQRPASDTAQRPGQ